MLQTQYAPSGYVGLWTRLRDFERASLTRALEAGDVVQATLLRTTIHLVSRREFWPYARAIREVRRVALLRARRDVPEATLLAAAERLRVALADGPRTVRELDGLVRGFIGTASLYVDLARVPPSGTWERRRADRLALAEQWVGPDDVQSNDAAVAHLVRAYLRGFGPASWRDMASWSGLPVSTLRAAGASLTLERFRDDHGRDLVDLPGAPLPGPDVPAPVRFLPHWDATLLVHARRAGILPEAYRPRVFSSKNPFSVGTVLVDGRVAAAWSVRDGRIVLDRFEETPSRVRDEVEAERAALETFHA